MRGKNRQLLVLQSPLQIPLLVDPITPIILIGSMALIVLIVMLLLPGPFYDEVKGTITQVEHRKVQIPPVLGPGIIPRGSVYKEYVTVTLDDGRIMDIDLPSEEEPYFHTEDRVICVVLTPKVGVQDIVAITKEEELINAAKQFPFLGAAAKSYGLI